MHIIWLGYLFVVVMFCFAQESWARGVLLFVLLAVLPTCLVAWMLRVKRRNRLSKRAENQTANDDKLAK